MRVSELLVHNTYGTVWSDTRILCCGKVREEEKYIAFVDKLPTPFQRVSQELHSFTRAQPISSQ